MVSPFRQILASQAYSLMRVALRTGWKPVLQATRSASPNGGRNEARIMSYRGIRSIAWIAVSIVVLGIVVALTPMKPTGGASPPQGGKQLWWDPMLGPSSVTDHPGKSAMGMDMVPYMPQGGGGPEVVIDPAVVQNMGVQTAPVTRGPLHKTIRAVGLFKLPEPGLHDISLKVGGWIDKLHADQEGMHVRQGEPLFALYSPELQVAEQELISAVQSQRSLGADASPALKKEAETLLDSARRKLQLWDVDEREIDAIAKADRPPRDVVFFSPATGHLEDKMVVQGSAVQPGTKLMRVADHTKMWLDAQVYEEQIPLVAMGQSVEVTADAIPGRTFTGKLTFVYPHMEHLTRTLTVRATFDNPGFELKPGMYADANIITEPVPDAVQVPQESVIDTGTRQIAFVAQGGGHFVPRKVRAGIRGDDDRLQIVDGLSVGETVVTSGQFLMDVESRTNEAVAKLRRPASAAKAMEATANDQELSVLHCPMARADWIQNPGETANPYMAAEMRQCGSVTGQLHVPAGSGLSNAVSTYLAVEKGLAADRLDRAAVEQLKSTVGQLHGPEYDKLREATGKLAASRQLAPARQQFKTVSDALIAALKSPSKN
jgi:RND family efflux transporter MFP subunit